MDGKSPSLPIRQVPKEKTLVLGAVQCERGTCAVPGVGEWHHVGGPAGWPVHNCGARYGRNSRELASAQFPTGLGWEVPPTPTGLSIDQS